ncbi:GGDEF domain-containing protein [Azospirillum canadense]|uniref:GGDEF domain-containing protein n=1 Tax=Azospirillum canadense TaxID=403962 RepID=UPI002225D841|nr:diguanylate cyclase [Azospirillum canadense]MCW2241639.1 diguanylate cyclase (GGDEF)-like protein [Azospirillum canadense]
MTSAVDGMVRIGAYRRLREFPLIVLVLLADEDVFAGTEGRWSAMVSVGRWASALLFGSALGIAWLLDRNRRSRNELETANAELRYLADTDVLTGAKNRRAFTALAERELARHQRYHRALSLIMMDLDHFKAVNDEHGHAAGDAVLIEVIRRCRDGLRRHDAIGRLGGEEFAILLPETGLSQAREVAERLRQSIAAASIFAPDGQALAVTASMGIAALGAGDLLDSLLSRADHALYQAKECGRNRSVVAGVEAAPA